MRTGQYLRHRKTKQVFVVRDVEPRTGLLLITNIIDGSEFYLSKDFFEEYEVISMLDARSE